MSSGGSRPSIQPPDILGWLTPCHPLPARVDLDGDDAVYDRGGNTSIGW